MSRPSACHCRISHSLLVLAGMAAANVGLAADPANDADAQANRFVELEKQLSGTALAGYSTDSNKAPTELRDDRYELAMVKHLQGDSWLVQAKFSYGGKDLTLPLTLPIRWAGDTPVISLDEFPVPGLGTFDARVVIYQDHYAGFWSGAGHSGHLFGEVKRADAENETAPAAPTSAPRDGKE